VAILVKEADAKKKVSLLREEKKVSISAPPTTHTHTHSENPKSKF